MKIKVSHWCAHTHPRISVLTKEKTPRCPLCDMRMIKYNNDSMKMFAEIEKLKD